MHPGRRKPGRIVRGDEWMALGAWWLSALSFGVWQRSWWAGVWMACIVLLIRWNRR